MEKSKSDIVIELMEQISTDDKLDAELTEEDLIQVVNKIKPNKAQGQMVSILTASKPNSLSFCHYCFNCSIDFYLKNLSRKIGEFLSKTSLQKQRGRKIQTITEDLHSAKVFKKFSHQFYKPDYKSGLLKTRR